ncbi:sterol desaturase family protein [Sphingomonas sp. SUN039]|uniref:sterol desaturase family protein n=1 Tax=Sphingomonas sp. SUN039 TaxID=2937787 RepID=UPI0021640CE9|nr:sterol desaturase family protein [Sphingomonas sp. SUN039]UVO53471.1 sterol desaturase family protein [Sphingomonas sp. SUN039]
MDEKQINAFFGDDAPKGFGTGWWSGVLAAFFGLLALGAVLCLHFPQYLTAPELRAFYPMDVMRWGIKGLIVAALVFGVVAALLRQKKALALTGLIAAFLATLLGGSSVVIDATLHNGPAIGFDWFLLDMLLMAAIYVPIERLWPYYVDQGTFRDQWALDVIYFASTHLPIQIMSFMIMLPATQATKYLAIPSVAGAIADLPLVVQFFLAVVVADIAEWAIHFTMHKVPFLWRFHSIHHSSKALDWIAGSRAHFVEDFVVRGFILVPMMLAFSQGIIMAYLVFVTLHATWTHCNTRMNVKWLEPFLVMPRYHHWHHASQKEAIDVNFAIHFPWIDRLFGTYYYPKHWPTKYGLDEEEIGSGFIRQTWEPFVRPNRRISESQPL